MNNSPGFSKFRELLDRWDESLNKEAKKGKIKNLIDGQGLLLFFKKDNKIYGAPEPSRIVFARMKSPDDEMPDEDANFGAYDLAQALLGNSVENIFSAADLPKIAIINRDEAENGLLSCPEKAQNAKLNPLKGDKNGIGIIKLKDRAK